MIRPGQGGWGKANTCPRNQTGHWRGYNLLAGKKGSKRGLRPGEEIFVPYGREYNLHAGGNGVDDARQGWGFARRRRQAGGGRRETGQTAVLVPTHNDLGLPPPPPGGRGEKPSIPGCPCFSTRPRCVGTNVQPEKRCRPVLPGLR